MNRREVDDYLISCLQQVVNCRTTKPDGYEFKCLEDVVLTHGVLFKPVQLPDKYRKLPKKLCFENAFRLMKRHAELTYCEGYATYHNLYPFLHGWCIDKNGNVVDPTWDYSEMGIAYLGIPFPRDYAIRAHEIAQGSLLDNPRQGFPLMRQFNLDVDYPKKRTQEIFNFTP